MLLAAYRAFAGPDRVKWALLLVFPAVYFYLINGWGFMFARYALPTVPFIALWAAIAGVWLADRLSVVPVPASGRRAAIARSLLLLLVVPGALGSIAFVRAHGAETTQTLAWAWMKKSIWPGSSILSEARGLELPSERYRAEVVSSVAEQGWPEAIVGVRRRVDRALVGCVGRPPAARG